MPGNNSDYIRRLEKDGRRDLLKQIKEGEISVYAAAKKAGYRKGRGAQSRADQVTYHWTRANAAEKRRFIIDNWSTVGPLAIQVLKHISAQSKAQKPGA